MFYAGFCWGSFCKAVYYGYARWPSYSYWIVPGTITDEERAKCHSYSTGTAATPSRYNHPEDQIVVSNPAADGSPARANTQSRTGTITSY